MTIKSDLFYLFIFFFYCSFSDLLVGAPYYRHSEYGDEGRVYTYINSGKVTVKRRFCVIAVFDWNFDPLARAQNLTAVSSSWDAINLFALQAPVTLNHEESMTLDGRKTMRSLFGYAMAVAGDLNRDGFPGTRQKLSVVERQSDVSDNEEQGTGNRERGTVVWGRSPA